MLNHCLAALLKDNENKMLGLTITLLHILWGKTKDRGEKEMNNLSKLMIFIRNRLNFIIF